MTLWGPLSGCGDSSAEKDTLGSPSNPQIGKAVRGQESAPEQPNQSGSPKRPASRSSAQKSSEDSATTPGYQGLVANQSRRPESRFTPCNLVTRSRATAIIGSPILEPLEATQGPTCIYRSTSGKSFVTLAVQRVDFRKIKPHIRQRRRITVANRTAYCGTHGRPMLYLPLPGGRVLSISARCGVASQFAVTAITQLKS